MRHKVATTDEFDGDGTRILAEIDGLEIAVFYLDDEYHALANYCVHQGGPLCEGQVTGKMEPGEDGITWKYDGDPRYVVCPWHEWKFDITDGVNVSDQRYVTPTFPTTVEGDTIYVHR